MRNKIAEFLIAVAVDWIATSEWRKNNGYE
jgi:hypothetical protein